MVMADIFLPFRVMTYSNTEVKLSFLYAVLSPEQVSEMEHVLPLWMTSTGGSKLKNLYQQVRLGARVSSLSSDEV